MVFYTPVSRMTHTSDVHTHENCDNLCSTIVLFLYRVCFRSTTQHVERKIYHASRPHGPLARLVSDTTYDTACFYTPHTFLPYPYRLLHIPFPYVQSSLTLFPIHLFPYPSDQSPNTSKLFYLQTPLPWYVLTFPNLHTRNPRSPHLPPNRPVISRTSFLNHHSLPIQIFPKPHLPLKGRQRFLHSPHQPRHIS